MCGDAVSLFGTNFVSRAVPSVSWTRVSALSRVHCDLDCERVNGEKSFVVFIIST